MMIKDFFRKKPTVYWNSKLNDIEVSLLDYIVPTTKKLPSWYKNSKKLPKQKDVKGCPAFINLFSQSMTYISPCDMSIEVGRHGYKVDFPINADYWFEIGFHKGDDISGEWHDDVKNIKLQPPLILKSNKNIKVIFLPSYYHDPNNKLSAAIGPIDFIPGRTIDLGLNLFMNFKGMSQSETFKFDIKAGDPLAYLYFPDGIPKFEYKKIKHLMARYFRTDYYKSSKKQL